MKVLGINGSHRAGKGTAALLQAALDGAAEHAAALEVPVSCELVELSRLDIEFCIGCNRCLVQTSCTLADDMNDSTRSCGTPTSSCSDRRTTSAP